MVAFPTDVAAAQEACGAEAFLDWEYGPERFAELRYRLRLPLGFERAPGRLRAPTLRAPFSSLGVFLNLESPFGCVAVYGAVVRREIAPADWLFTSLPSWGQEVLDAIRYPTIAGDCAHALTRADDEAGEGYVSRWRVFKDSGPFGGTIFLVEARCLETEYEGHAHEILATISSVRMVAPSGFPIAEKLQVFERSQPIRLRTMYPSSWVPDSFVGSMPGRGFVTHLYHLEEAKLYGKMTLSSTGGLGSRDRDRVLNAYAGSLAADGWAAELGGLRAAPLGTVANAWWCEATASKEGADLPYEVKVGVAWVRNAWLLVALLGVHREAIPELGAINARAFEIATRHLEVFE